MNKHVHRLVFDRRRGMRVPAAEHVRCAGKAGSGQSRAVALVGAMSMLMGTLAEAQTQMVRVSPTASVMGASRVSASATPPPMSATRSVADMVSQTLASGRPNLPKFSNDYRGDNLGVFDDPSTSADGYVMTLLQKSGAIVVNWDSFDIGKGYTVNFVQPQGGRALNKVRSGETSLIDGALKANGEVMIENGAGIIFGKNARVNTGSLVATALSIAQDAMGDLSKPDDAKALNLYQWRDGRPVFGGDEGNTAGFVATEAGAVIQSLAGGKVVMVAPRVVNKGVIESPSGQTVLAAGKTVYLYAPVDTAQRGLLVAVDNFTDATLTQIEAQTKAELGLPSTATVPADIQPLGTVENVREGGAYASGLVRADRGTINLVGAAIRQKGQLTATTAVKAQNGAIFLQAMKDTYTDASNVRRARTLGTVELGQGSITEVLPSVGGLLNPDGTSLASQTVMGTVKGDSPGTDITLYKIGVDPHETLRAPLTLSEPVRPTVPAEDATEAVKTKYQEDLKKYEADKKAYDAAEQFVQTSSNTFYRSRIDILGSDITLRAGSRVQAPGGEINILAAKDWQLSPLRLAENVTNQNDGSRILMEAGAVVDVSGLDNLLLPAQRNQLSVQLFSIELADSPLQRAGVVYRQTVMADARRFLSLGDASGYYSNLRYTAAEFSTSGGVLRMQSQGALMLDPLARLDFSGGAVTYDAAKNGQLVSSVLLRDGLITLANKARADVTYDAFISDPTQASEEELARHGLSRKDIEDTGSPLPGQFVGMSAGAAMLGAPVQSLGAVLDGSVRMSDVQRQSAVEAGRDPGLATLLKPSAANPPAWLGLDDVTAADRVVRLSQWLTREAGEAASGYQPHLFASLRPTAGLLVVGREIGSESGSRALNSLVSSVRITGQTTAAPSISADMDAAAWANLVAAVGNTTALSADRLERAGLAGATLFADQVQYGNEAAQDAPRLQLAAGGNFTAKAREGDVAIHGSITVAGGSIDVTAQSGDVHLSAGSRLDAGGTRRADRAAGAQTPAPGLKGGSISLSAFGDVVLASGSEVDVSGAAWHGVDGSVVQGRAGTLTLSVNSGVSSATMPTGALTLAGTLSGFDFSDGGTLKLSGLPNVVLGGTAAGAFSLDQNLYAHRGFGTVEMTALGDVDVLAGARIAPVLVNMLPVSSALGGVLGRTYTLTTLETGLRSGTHLSLSASTTPAVAGETRNGFGVGEGADLRVAQGTVLDMGLGGSITLSAGGSVDMAGTLRAQGGDVALGILGKRGVLNTSENEGYGHVIGQAIHLRAGSLIDVSGAVKAVEQRNSIARLTGLPAVWVGEVLAGGTVTLGGVDGTPVRGQVLMEDKATIVLDGASGWLSRDGTGRASLSSSAAGTLNIMSTDGFSLLGQVRAKAPDASVAGGTINIALSREGTIDNVQAGGRAYPADADAGQRSIRITDTQVAAAQLGGTSRLFGEGVVSAELLNNAGADRIQLRADDTIQLNAGVSLKADEGRTRLQSVVLDAPVLELTNRLKSTVVKNADGSITTTVADEAAPTSPKEAADHLIQAHHVAMGPVTARGGTPGTVTASQRTLTGDRWLEVQAGLIELNGDTAVQGANRVDMNATLGRTKQTTLDRQNGEIRFIGQRPLSAALDGDRALRGQFSFQGALNLTAGQVYATTMSQYAVLGKQGSTLTLNAPGEGSTSQTPLSALASLKLQATDVTLNGVVRQPVGSIDVTADKLTLGDGAVLSISADGVTVPVGMTVNNAQWVYSPQGDVAGNVPTVDNTVIDITTLPITKQIALNGRTISLSTSSLVEAQAGGDIAAWQFNPGVGGSTDTYLRPGVFAVLPSYGFDFAPYDADIRARALQAGSTLKAGDQVTITTANDVLGAGTYTLLDARYAILPGAVLVSAGSLNLHGRMPAALKNDDGSVVVSGHGTATGTTQNGGNDPRQTLVLEPEKAFRPKSDITVVSGNEFQNARARKEGITLTRPGDAGRVSLSSETAFDWQARFNFAGKDGLKAGEFDLAMPDIEVRRTRSATATAAGVVSLDQLNALGADSVLLGGVRQSDVQEDGTEKVTVTRKASSVVFVAEQGVDGQPLTGEANTLRTTGELMAVAQRTVRVDAGLTIASTGVDDGRSRHYALQGDGALMQVGHRAATDVTVVGATVGSQATLSVGGAQAGAASVTLRGASVQLDSTGTNTLAANTMLQARSLGLGAGSVVVGDAANPAAGALQINGALLNRLNLTERLALRASAGSLALASGTQLGGEATKQITLDAPQLLGVAAQGQSAQAAAQAETVVSAQEVVLRNGSGQAAVDQTGVGRLKVQARPVSTDGRTGGIKVDESGAGGQRWGFAAATLESSGDIVFSGQGQTRAQGDVTLSAARVTATADARQQLSAQGDLLIKRSAGSHTLNESLGAGGRLNLEGRTVQQQGNIDIESGRLGLVARGDQGAQVEALVFAAGSTTSVAGRLRKLSDTHAVASGGGQLTAEAQQGAIVVDGTLSAAAPVMPSGMTGEAPAAGSITLKAAGAGGQVQLGQQARLDVSGAAGQSGTVAVDTRQLALTQAAATAASTNAALAQNGLDQLVASSRNTDGASLREFNVRQREGDLQLNSALKAAKVVLSADGGDLSLDAQADIDATTAGGGVVQLQARDDLILNDGARIEAHSTREGANGGDVLLGSSGGSIRLGAATVVADSDGDAQDGRIVLRALQTTNAQGQYTGMKVSTLAGSAPAVLQAGRVQLEGVRVYDSATLTSLGTGAGTASNLNLATLVSAATSFAGRQDDILSAAGLAGTANASVRAGAEIRAQNDFRIANDLVLAANNQPMNLTIRAAGNLNIDNSISAGLNNALATGTIQAGEGASLRLVAGADLTSANTNATKVGADTGHVTLASGKLVRTTTGSIDVHASGDVRLMAATLTSPSAIYVTGKRSELDAAKEVFAVENTQPSKNSAANAYPTASAVFTERGERLTVSAGGDVGSFERVVKVDGVDVKTSQQVLQGTGNYFVHGGAYGGATPLLNVPVAWFSRFNDFRLGLGSFGGGNVDIRAGASVSNLAVVAPTNGRAILNLDETGTVRSSSLKVLNGGDITVSAGGDIQGGLYFLGRGEGRLSAGGGVLPGEDKQGDALLPVSSKLIDPGAMLALMDGRWSVNAVDDVTVSHIFNPTAQPFAVGQGLTDRRASVYFTYADNAGVSLSAVKGSVTLAPDNLNFSLLLSAFSPVQKLTAAQAEQAAQLASVLPPVVNLVSLSKDVIIDAAGRYNDGTQATNGLDGARMYVMPSVLSDVNMYAGRDLILQANLQLLEAAQITGGLPSVTSPVTFAPVVAGMRDMPGLAKQLALSDEAENPATASFFYNSTASNSLMANPIADLGQALNDRVVHLYAGNDVVFSDVLDTFVGSNGSSRNRSVKSYLRTSRPTEIVAGRDIVNPHFVGQNFDESDVTRLVAGRDIIGMSLANSLSRVIAVGGPGLLQLEAGRDIELNRMSGVFAIGNQINNALPAASAKISVIAGASKTVNMDELRARHGGNAKLRQAINQALEGSGLMPTEGAASWAALGDAEVFAAFGQLTEKRQTEAVQAFLNESFAALYLPEDAGQSAAYYRSTAFQRKKQEAMWAQIQKAAADANAIAVSTDAAEEANRKLRRQALFDAAEAVADLAGHGVTFDSTGNVNVGQARAHNQGQGGGHVLGRADDSLGGIDVIASGQVLAGLPTSAEAPGGFINYLGGSFRSVSLGDFLAGDQKVISLGRGNLLVYSVRGSIDSGKGSNTSLTADVPQRAFNALTGLVEARGNPPTSGSGFQKVQTPSDMTPVIGLYAPNGEIRALDAFIKGDANISIVAPTVLGADNIGGASGVASPPPPTVNLSLTPKVADTAAGATQLAASAESASKAPARSVLTVDLLGFGNSEATTQFEVNAQKDIPNALLKEAGGGE